MDQTLELALDTIRIGKQAIVFVANRASAEKTAEDVAKLTAFVYPDLEDAVLHALPTPTKQCRRLSHCVRKGVAFHHAGLTSSQKELIEEEFRKGTIKIICATPTLAAGLSLPVFRVIIKSLKRFSGQWGMDWIAVLEYMQMAGRAGRPEYESYGEAISIAKDEREQLEIYEKYICGEPENIYSKLAVEPVLRTHLLSLISTGIIYDTVSMHGFFSKTFWAYQFEDTQKLYLILDKMLGLLREWRFVEKEATQENDTTLQETKIESMGFRSASALIEARKKNENEKLVATSLGQRVAQLYLDPLSAYQLLEGCAKYTPASSTFGLLHLICTTLEMRPLLNLKVKDQQKVQEEMWKRSESFLVKEPDQFDLDYEEFLSSVKTALFLDSWIDEKDEEYLLEKFDIRPGEIRVKIESCVWLLNAIRELCHITNLEHVIKPLHVLGIRVDEGVREELLTLLQLRGVGRVRARRLYHNGVKDIGDVKKVDITTLSQILGKALAVDVKKQVGETIEVVAPTKRKGQMSLGKY
ncbi:hypothetical protein HYV86_07000 [Candidatus Woesearchaeota archaeon]|nr:hypothetical protein [Candidatus Woesearchaeota archaeon]